MSRFVKSLSRANVALSELVVVLDEASKAKKGKKRAKDGGDGEDVVDGKKGVWRDVSGNPVFFPDDGAKPVGMPKALRGKGASGGGAEGGGGGQKAARVKRKLKSTSKGLKKAVSGSGSAAVEDLKNSGSNEDKEAIDDLENDRDVSKKRMEALAANGVRKAAIIGVGAALAVAFPGLLGIALTLLLVDKAISAVGKKIMGEDKTSKVNKLASDIESSISTALDSIISGDLDEDELMAAIAKAKKNRGDAE